MTTARRTFHHGDLRGELVRRARRIVDRSGAPAVSLRDLARACGVSPRAPYRHFRDRRALLAAVAEVGFLEFRAALEAGLEGEVGPRARLTGLAHAYVAFARQNPRLTELLFSDAFPQRQRRHPALHRAALAAFESLASEVPGHAPTLAVAGWALVHGLANLLRQSSLRDVLGSDVRAEALVTASLEAFFDGALRPTRR